MTLPATEAVNGTAFGKSLHHEAFQNSRALLPAHEDETYSGAMIVSLSPPWGGER